jgi:hypothetical protein
MARGADTDCEVVQKAPMSALSPRTPSPLIDRSVLTSTPTPLRRQGPEPSPLASEPPRFVFYTLREEDDPDIGFSALSPEEAVEPADVLAGRFTGRTQFICATASAEAALFFSESSSGPGFASARAGLPRANSKRVVAKIDLGSFKGEVLDVSSLAGCGQHELKKDAKAWEFALDHQMVLLVGYVPPRLVTAVFDLEMNPLPPLRTSPASPHRKPVSLDTFTASLPVLVKQILVRDWAGDTVGQRMERAMGKKSRDAQGLATDARSRSEVCWDAKQRLDEEMRKLELRKKRLAPQLEMVTDYEMTACEKAFKEASIKGMIGPAEESHILVMRDWHCLHEYPFCARTTCNMDSEVMLRGTQFQARLALSGPAALRSVHQVAIEAPMDGCPCRHCMWTKPAEFQLLRNVSADGPSVVWPPYFRLFCFDPTTEELEELLNTLGGSRIRDSEHPHVFPSDEVGFAFGLDRLPWALAGLKATLPLTEVTETDQVALPQRPLYLVVVVPQGVPRMVGQEDEEAPLYCPPCP